MKYDQIIFSPHLDDGVLSCGGLIASLKNKKSSLIYDNCHFHYENHFWLFYFSNSLIIFFNHKFFKRKYPVWDRWNWKKIL